jgi:hypothetical protein
MILDTSIARLILVAISFQLTLASQPILCLMKRLAALLLFVGNNPTASSRLARHSLSHKLGYANRGV